MGDNNGDCTLECQHPIYKVKKALAPYTTSEVHEFVGPVKIVLVDPPVGEYQKKSWGAAFITMAYFSIGAALFPVLFYTLQFKLKLYNNLHVLLCTIGFQLFIPTALLTLNGYNSASHLMKEKHRKLESFMLKFVGFFCIGAGVSSLFLEKDFDITDLESPHAFAGITAAALALLDVISTPCLLLNQRRVMARFCNCLSLPSFLMSSLCFILGIQTPSFEKYVPVFHIIDLTIGFCVYYSLVVAFDPLKKLFCGL